MKSFLFLLATCYPAWSHEYSDFKIGKSHTALDGRMFVVNLQDTVSGHSVVCALYDEEGVLLTSESTRTDNLATQVRFLDGFEGAASIRCVLDE